MTKTFLEVATPNCSAEEFDGELVAINLETGIYFSIKQSGAAIWRDLAAGHAVEDLKAQAGSRAELQDGIDSFIRQLTDNGLMRGTASPAVPDQPAGFANIASTAALPELESFGDMQSLLLLDPVHEVDNDAGWPVEDKK